MPGLFEDFNPIQRIAANQYGASVKEIGRGSLISFHYPRSWAIIPNIIHDPYPVILITNIWSKYVCGVNLHYLRYQEIQSLLTYWGGNSGFSWAAIKKSRLYMPLRYAIRMYVRGGIVTPKKLDSPFLLQVLKSVRTFSPGELEQIKLTIQKQIQQRLQAKANEMTSYEDWRAKLSKSQQRQFGQKVGSMQQLAADMR
jgi:hypothetical protein